MRQKKLNAAGPDSDRRNFEGKKDVFRSKLDFCLYLGENENLQV